MSSRPLFRAVDPLSVRLRHPAGTQVLAAAYETRVAVLARGEHGLLLTADLNDGGAFVIEGEVDSYGHHDLWFSAGELLPGATRVLVLDRKGWVDALVSREGAAWLAPTESSEPVVRFEDAHGRVVARPLPPLASRSPITDAVSECPACEGTSWEEIRYRPEHEPWDTTEARCQRCGFRIDLQLPDPGWADNDDWGDDPVDAESLPPLGDREVRTAFRSGEPLYELEAWHGTRMWAAYDFETRFVPDDSPRAFKLAFGERRVSEPWALISTNRDTSFLRESVAMSLHEWAGDPFEPTPISDDASAAAWALAEALAGPSFGDPPAGVDLHPVTIHVEGVPTPFVMGSIGTTWVAAGQVANDLAVLVVAHRIPIERCTLRRVTDIEPFLLASEE